MNLKDIIGNVLGKAAGVWQSVTCVAVSLLFVVLGFVALNVPAPETAETTATIVEVVAPENEDDAGYTVIDYREQDGTEHRNVEYSSYSSWWKPGDEIKITYEVDDPENVGGTAPRWVLPAVFMIIGTVMLGLFGVRLAKRAWGRY